MSKLSPKKIRSITRNCLCTAAWMALTGCAVSRVLPVSQDGSALHGSVHGGQQPVTGAVVQLYVAGGAGNGSAATPLLARAVRTDAQGGFDITGAYTCPGASSQVYLTATGGNPGLAAGVNNAALAMVVALGDCGSLPAMQSVAVNEQTTAAAAWALAPFASAVDRMGASATNLAGLRNAMQTAQMMADPGTGAAPSAALPANAQMETAKLVTLADILSTCVNSDGTAACSSLFAHATPAGMTAPADTFQAALTIAQNPGHNVATLFNDAPSRGPFAGGLATAPHDWTMSIAYRGGGLQNPGDVTVDGQGNVWVADRAGAISGYLPTGAPMWANGLTGMGLAGTMAIAIDPAGNVWAANSSNGGTGNSSGSVTEVTASGQGLSSTSGYVAGVDLPVSVAIGADGRAWVANSGQSNVLVLNSDGTLASSPIGYGDGRLQMPSAIALTGGSDAWVTGRSSGNVALISAEGVVLKDVHCAGAPDSLALDLTGNVWVGDSANGTLLLVQSNGAFGAAIDSGSGLHVPRSPAIDGAGNLFVVNAGSAAIGAVPRARMTAAGVLTGAMPMLGQDALLQDPTALALDASGNLWVTSAQDNRLVRFVGMASPVKTPLLGAPAAP